MWIEAILSEEDVAGLVKQLTPVRVDLGTEASQSRWLHLGRPSSVTIVKGEGVRIVTRAKVQWSVSVLRVPFTLLNLQLLLRPRVVSPDGETGRGRLVFQMEIEDADFEHVPEVIDRTITKAVNAELAGQPLAWDFAAALSHRFPLPRTLAPLEALALDASWGEVKITDSALMFAVSFRSTVFRATASEDVGSLDPEDGTEV
jgi:hypothetical protein